MHIMYNFISVESDVLFCKLSIQIIQLNLKPKDIYDSDILIL